MNYYCYIWLHNAWLMSCRSRWNIGPVAYPALSHANAASIFLRLYTCILMSIFLSQDLFSRCSLVSLYLCSPMWCPLYTCLIVCPSQFHFPPFGRSTVLDCGTSISPLLPVSGCHELLTGSDTICTSGCRDLSGTRVDVLSHAQVRRACPDLFCSTSLVLLV